MEFGEKKRKIRAITPSKVIYHRDRYQSKAIRDFLLVINTNGVIAAVAVCSNFGHFVFLTAFGGLRDNVR